MWCIPIPPPLVLESLRSTQIWEATLPFEDGDPPGRNVVARRLRRSLWKAKPRWFRINVEVHVGWCPPRTSNPVGLLLVDRSVRFRLTSASFILRPPARSSVFRRPGMRLRQRRDGSLSYGPTPKTETVTGHQGGEAASAPARRFAAADFASRKPEAETTQAQKTNG